jgi:3-hydroxybutyryl-CoA dehydrogenase
MGHGIAQVVAMTGRQVAICDSQPSIVETAFERIKRNLEGAVGRGKLSSSEAEETLTRITLASDLEAACDGADLVVEAVPEDVTLKKQLLSKIDRAAPPEALIGSNTSSLSITELQMATERPEQLIGLHFFNPVHIMKLVEVVVGERTSDATIEAARRLIIALGKEPIVVRDSPGFATSRLGIALGNEAMRMLEEGVASAADIDKAMVLGYRHPMGPLKLSDLVGLDVRLAITEHLYRELGSDTFHPPKILRRMVRANKLGRKTGEGFYRYGDDS